MLLSSLQIRNFRNIAEAVLSFEPGLNLFTGLNAQGKTNVIESILFLATSLSHRTRKEDDLIRFGTDTAYLRGAVANQGEESSIECGLEKNRKVIKVDGNPLNRVGDLYGCLRVVLFAPEDLEIITGSPQTRRRFLDMAIAQIDPGYIEILQRFRKALRQRNSLLKRMAGKSAAPNPELDAWDRHYLNFAAQVVDNRLQALSALNPLLTGLYERLADDGPLALAYSFQTSGGVDAIRDALAKKLAKNRAFDIERGSTHSGPHRDDILFRLGDKSLHQFGSQGQRRSAALASRMAEARWCHAQTLSLPLLLIDDVVYEMDNIRRAKFWELMDLSGQAVITATDREHLGIQIQPNQIYQVNDGKIVCL